MDVVAGLGVLAALVAGVVWLERLAARADAEEDEALAKGLEGMPEGLRWQLWAAHFRARADRDLH